VFQVWYVADLGEALLSWPPAYPSPYYNLTKKEQKEYDAVVERDGDRCIETGGPWAVFHHVRYGAEVKRVPDRNNMILLSRLYHGTGPEGAHGPNAKAKQREYLKYLEEA